MNASDFLVDLEIPAAVENLASYQFALGVVYIVLFVFGCVGNMLTLLSTCTDRQLRTIPNAYVANLAMMDFTICCSMTVTPAYFVFTGQTFPHCRVFGFIAIYAIACSRLHLCCIAVNRYALIVRGMNFYMKVYTKRNIIISVIGSYLIPFVILVAALTERFSRFTYNSVVMNCFFEESSYQTYWYITGLMELMFFMPALFLTITVYILIIRKFRQARRKVATADGTTFSEKYSLPAVSVMISSATIPAQFMARIQSRVSMSKEKKCVLNMVTVFAVFLLCWSPLCFALMFDYYFKLSPKVYSLFMLFGVSNSALNVLIYAGMNTQFRKSYVRLITCKCCKKND